MRKQKRDSKSWPSRFCSQCKRHHTKQWREANPGAFSRNNPIEKRLYWSARTRAKIRGIPFSLELSDIAVPKHCPVLGIPLVEARQRGKGTRKNSPSLDRIRPELGYVPGNVVVISGHANWIKAAATSAEVLAVGEWMRRQGL